MVFLNLFMHVYVSVINQQVLPVIFYITFNFMWAQKWCSKSVQPNLAIFICQKSVFRMISAHVRSCTLGMQARCIAKKERKKSFPRKLYSAKTQKSVRTNRAEYKFTNHAKSERSCIIFFFFNVSEKNDTTSGADRFTTVKEPSWKDYKEGELKLHPIIHLPFTSPPHPHFMGTSLSSGCRWATAEQSLVNSSWVNECGPNQCASKSLQTKHSVIQIV